MTTRPIRQSMMGSADTCLRRFQYQLWPKPAGFVQPNSAARMVGTAYHYVLEGYYGDWGEVIGRDKFDEAEIARLAAISLDDQLNLFPDVIWSDDVTNRDDALELVTSLAMSYFGGGYAWPSLDFEVLGTEVPFNIEAGELCDVALHGTADLVLFHEPSNTIYLDDHKTAGRMWDQYKHTARKNDQAKLYTAVFRHLYPGRNVRFSFSIMTYKGKFERRMVDPTPAECGEVLRKAEQVGVLVDLTQQGVLLPTNTSSTLCSEKWCDFWSLCPGGAGLTDEPVSVQLRAVA